ncbi:Uncharacterised protein [Cedecea neteri]|uniref:Uncharacterized protein n=1 Tax=Cedecea neteri TaxID=158822 RepID=A0A2X3KWJ6_9ENTR|nr:Uncharacterised protein [Cedecea neteri]
MLLFWHFGPTQLFGQLAELLLLRFIFKGEGIDGPPPREG